MDKYTTQARLLPVFIAFLPVGIVIIGLFPKKILGWELLTGVLTSLGLTVLLSQLGRDLGKKKESKLFNKWGGIPAVVMLRHNNTRLNKTTKNRYHEKLSKLLNIKIPSLDDENRNPDKADEIYKSCIDYLRERTRDKALFPLILEENINYGFRRNLWAMKLASITINIISLFVIAGDIYYNVCHCSKILPITIISFVIIVSILVIWFFRINSNWVKLAAFAYAERLLAACEEL